MRASVVLWMLVGPAALAEDAEATLRAKALFDLGLSSYRLGDYESALSSFQTAYQAKSHPVILFNLARCYEKTGELEKALTHFGSYVQRLPDARDRESVEAVLRSLEGRLRSATQELLVRSQPEGAEVQIDGQPRGRAPVSARLPLGDHEVSASAPGFELLQRRVVLAFVRGVELDFVLPRRGVTAPPAAVRETARKAELPREAFDFIEAYEAKQLVVRRGAWISAGLAAAGLAVAGGFQLRASALYGDDGLPGTFSYYRTKIENGIVSDGATDFHGEATRLRGEIQANETASYLAGAVGGAAAVVAAILWVVGDDPARYAKHKDVSVAAWAEPSGGRASITFAF